MAHDKKCFVMMPISDPEGYDSGHFDRVYKFLIQPACVQAGFRPVRADEVNKTNYIVADIVKEILECDMAVCDLSARNPNVMYELGIRHAFSRPVVLIRDTRTSRVFDVQGLRDIDYDATLRIDTIQQKVDKLADGLKNTHNSSPGDITSPIQFLHVRPAARPESTEISKETALLLSAMSSLGDRLSAVERSVHNVPKTLGELAGASSTRTEPISGGDIVLHPKYSYGIVEEVNDPILMVYFGPSLHLVTHMDDVVKVTDPDQISTVRKNLGSLAQRHRKPVKR